jgi:hypothetical protein
VIAPATDAPRGERTHAVAPHVAEGRGLKCQPRRSMTSSVTGARPEKPNARAAAGVTSMTRPRTNGPRSLIRTTPILSRILSLYFIE